jgi:hypothetical protein
MIAYNDHYTTSPDLSKYFIEMTFILRHTNEKEWLFHLFKYLVERGYDQPASDLIDYMLRKKIIAKPL